MKILSEGPKDIVVLRALGIADTHLRSYDSHLALVLRIPGYLMRLSPLLGVLQYDAAPMIIDKPPFLDLLQRSKAAEAGEIIV